MMTQLNVLVGLLLQQAELQWQLWLLPLFIIILVLMLKQKKSKERYNAIIYKVESGACRDEFGLLNKKVIDEIQDWNESVTYNKNIQEDFWVGIFIPNVYDQFEIIDYTKYGRE